MSGRESRGVVVPAPLLVLGGVVSVQFGGALAATLVPEIGAGGSVLLRIGISAAILGVLVRPRLRGRSRQDWTTVVAFGVALGLMNWSFYGSLAHLPLGVAVTVEFMGPLLLTTVLSRRLLDLVAVAAAAAGVLLISEAFTVPLTELSWVGLLLAGTAGALWAAYILLSSRTGAAFERLDGLAIALLVSTVVVLPAGLPSVGEWTRVHLLMGLGLAVLSSLLPYSLELLALRRLAKPVFGILLSLEPAVAAVAGLLVLGQVLDGLQVVGLVLVVLASVIVLGLGARRGPAVAVEEPELTRST
ncbi:inner membrane transporter RhtA [Nocardioides scoriae]|uniref:Inner membrane transporter RhtA n=1 Tax=Nocardioides scoriae TaxID=642780 RepID=A0A1H1T490_9ACTN|nr:EamA family transporter [Nocardioides scoriae]SDS55072.1 inner membrane transporter RhtA [Nocardioides scoriae]